MRKEYEIPQMEVCLFESGDVIRTSYGDNIVDTDQW